MDKQPSSLPEETQMDEDQSSPSDDVEESALKMKSLNLNKSKSHLRVLSSSESEISEEQKSPTTNVTPTSFVGSSFKHQSGIPAASSSESQSSAEQKSPRMIVSLKSSDDDKTTSLPISWKMQETTSRSKVSPSSVSSRSRKSRSLSRENSPRRTGSTRSISSSSFRTPKPVEKTRQPRRAATPCYSPASPACSTPPLGRRRINQRSITPSYSDEQMEVMANEIGYYYENEEADIYHLIVELDYPIDLVIDGWIKFFELGAQTDDEDYNTRKKGDSVMILLQFIISCCGCKGKVFNYELARKLLNEDNEIDTAKIVQWMYKEYMKSPKLDHQVLQSKKERNNFLEILNSFWRMFVQKCDLNFCLQYLSEPIVKLLIDISNHENSSGISLMNFFVTSTSMALCIATGLLIRGLSRLILREIFGEILNKVFRKKIWLNCNDLDLIYAEEYAKWIFMMPSILDEDLQPSKYNKTLFLHKVNEVRKITLKGLLKVFETHDTAKTESFVHIAYMVAGDSLNVNSISPTAINIIRICKQHPAVPHIWSTIEDIVHYKIYDLNPEIAQAAGHYLNDQIVEEDTDTKAVLNNLIVFYNETNPASMARLVKVMIEINQALLDWETMVEILVFDCPDDESDFLRMVNLIVNCLEQASTKHDTENQVLTLENQVTQITNTFGPVITDMIKKYSEAGNLRVLANLLTIPRYLNVNLLEQKELAEPLFSVLHKLLKAELDDVLLNVISKTLKSFGFVEKFAKQITDLCNEEWENFLGYFALIKKSVTLSADIVDDFYTTTKRIFALICYNNFNTLARFEFNYLNAAARFFLSQFQEEPRYASLILKCLAKIMATSLFRRTEEENSLEMGDLSESEIGERDKKVKSEVTYFVLFVTITLDDPNEIYGWTLKREVFKLACDVAKRQILFIKDDRFAKLLSQFIDRYLFVDTLVTDPNSTETEDYTKNIALMMLRAYCYLVVYNRNLYKPETLLKHYKYKEKYVGKFQQKYFEIIDGVVNDLKKHGRKALINEMYLCLLRQFKNDTDCEVPHSLEKLKGTADRFLDLIKFRNEDEECLESIHESLMERALAAEENLTIFATMYTFFIHLSESTKNRLLLRLEELLKLNRRREIVHSFWVASYKSFLKGETTKKAVPGKKKEGRKTGRGYPQLDVTVEHSR